MGGEPGVRAQPRNAHGGWAVGANGGVLRTGAAGFSWAQFSAIFPPPWRIPGAPGHERTRVSSSAGSGTCSWAHGLRCWLPLGSRGAVGVQDSRVGEHNGRPPLPDRKERGRKCGENWKRNPSGPEQQTKARRPPVSLGLVRPALVASAQLSRHQGWWLS